MLGKYRAFSITAGDMPLVSVVAYLDGRKYEKQIYRCEHKDTSLLTYRVVAYFNAHGDLF
ncbi:hypothetical protein GCM10009112_07080 [Marinomonas arenicola]